MSGFLLDTNVVIWLLLGDRGAIAPEARQALEDDANTLFFSAASVWEIAIKRSLGKLEIEPHWYRELMSLDLVPLLINTDHAQHVEQLPMRHRDPFDRLLISQAQIEGLVLMSPDPAFDAYEVEVVW